MSYLPDGLPTPAPARDGVDAAFWEGLRDGELRVQRCTACGRAQHPAEWTCTWCGAPDPRWTPIPATGRVYSWTRVWHPAHPALAEACPYVAVVVEVQPDVLLLGNLLGDAEAPVEIGAPVEGAFEDGLLQWRRA